MIHELAHAKINLNLDILGKRPDGFHEVSMIMQTIKLADELELEALSQGIQLTTNTSKIVCNEPFPVDEKNLAWRAALKVQKFCGKNLGVCINLTKRIPIAAGLAGGSADAAAAIRGMNKLYKLKLTPAQLCRIGAQVGSDVPFCLIGGTCLAEGRGEILTRLPSLKKFGVVLVKPPEEISTAWAYKNYDEQSEKIRPQTQKILSLLQKKDYDSAFKYFENAFEVVVLKKIPKIVEYKNKLLSAGAKVALMSGSGATVFALTDKTDAEKIAASVTDSFSEVFVTETISENELVSENY